MERNKLVLLLAVLALIYFGEKWKHKFDRPWAYPSDSDQPLLLGKWEGEFSDPDGISKHMLVEINEPEEEGSSEHYENRRFDEAQTFKGYATITGKLGTEHDRIKGGLGSKDGHDVELIDFIPLDETKKIRESFNVSYTTPGGKWEGDLITVKLVFVFVTKTGSGYSDSGDPRFKKTVPVTLRRVK